MNTPITHQEVVDLPLGFTVTGVTMNRRQRRYSGPNSSKYSKHSDIYRKGRYNKK